MSNAIQSVVAKYSRFAQGENLTYGSLEYRGSPVESEAEVRKFMDLMGWTGDVQYEDIPGAWTISVPDEVLAELEEDGTYWVSKGGFEFEAEWI